MSDREGDKLLLAVTLPAHLAKDVRAEGPVKAEAGFPDAILGRIVALIQEGASVARSDDGGLPDTNDPIPF